MTLAVMLFVSLFCASAHPPVAAQNQSPPAVRPATPVGTQDSSSPAQSSSTATKSTSSPTKQSPSVQKPATAQHPHHKKKRIASNCVPASAAAKAPAPSGSNSATAAPPDAASTAATPGAQPATAPTVCPPPKVIVRQGGTSAPSIQLAGGAVGDQAAQQRHTANQMLGATEANLKKITGTQLTASQQDMIKQIHQFMDQSKTAVAAGDLERARTLAWKAQLLSEELVTPQK